MPNDDFLTMTVTSEWGNLLINTNHNDLNFCCIGHYYKRRQVTKITALLSFRLGYYIIQLLNMHTKYQFSEKKYELIINLLYIVHICKIFIRNNNENRILDRCVVTYRLPVSVLQ